MITGRTRRLPTVSRDRHVAWKARDLAWGRTTASATATAAVAHPPASPKPGRQPTRAARSHVEGVLQGFRS